MKSRAPTGEAATPFIPLEGGFLISYNTSKTPAGRQATEGRSRNVLWNAPGLDVFRLGYVAISSDSDSFATRLSPLSYVAPPSFTSTTFGFQPYLLRKQK